MKLGKIYTRGGDQGDSSLVSGERLSKADLQFEGIGNLDEMNSQFGLLIAMYLEDEIAVHDEIINLAKRLQNTLFDLGSVLACHPERIAPSLPRLSPDIIAIIEDQIDWMGAELSELPSFVLPGGCKLNAQAHVCRTVCRRVERSLVRLKGQLDDTQVLPAMEFTNRLSDWCFVFSRWISKEKNIPEVLWEHPLK